MERIKIAEVSLEMLTAGNVRRSCSFMAATISLSIETSLGN